MSVWQEVRLVENTLLLLQNMRCVFQVAMLINPLNVELNPICHLLPLLGAHRVLHVSRIKVKEAVRFLLLAADNARLSRRKRSGSCSLRQITIGFHGDSPKATSRGVGIPKMEKRIVGNFKILFCPEKKFGAACI